MASKSVIAKAWAFLRNRVGLHGLGLVVSIALIAFASIVLYRMLHDLKWSDVKDALAQKNLFHVAAAFVLVACAYLTLTFYDWFALRTIGQRHVPYRTAALAGFCSYSIGHNVGFTVLTGGSVRYRIYSGWGLGAIDVAKICFVAGLTFWLGNIAVLGLGITIHPEAATAVDHLPPMMNRIIGIAALAGLVGYVLWVSAAPRNIGHSNWFVTLPGGKLTLIQIGIGILDLSLCAAAMYMLMPGDPYIDPVSLAVVFVTATLLGFASHAPGGLGVFDAAFLVALPQFDKGELVGALLIFRVFYYLVPFALSLTLLGLRELSLGTFRLRGTPADPAAVAEAKGAVKEATSPLPAKAEGRGEGDASGSSPGVAVPGNRSVADPAAVK